MSAAWDWYENEVEFTARLLGEWLSNGQGTTPEGTPVRVFQLNRILNFSYPFRLEPERRAGLYTLLLNCAPDTPHLLVWRLEVCRSFWQHHLDLRFAQAALDDCERLCEVEAESNRSCGSLLLILGRYEDAIAAAQDDPLTLAKAFEHLEAHDKAIQVISEQLSSEVNASFEMRLLAHRGRLNHLAGKPGDRNADWDRLRQMAENQEASDVATVFARCHLSAGNFEQVLELTEDDSSIASDDDRLILRSHAYQGLAEEQVDPDLSDRSIDCLWRLVRINPNSADGWMKLIESLESRWDYERLIELAANRPSEDCRALVGETCIKSEYSLHAQLDQGLPYWKGRFAAQSGELSEALAQFDVAPATETTLMEKVVATKKIGDQDASEAAMDEVVNKFFGG